MTSSTSWRSAAAQRGARAPFVRPFEQEVMVRREFDAPRRLVWEACTEDAHLRRWLRGPEGWTLAECAVDFRPGGSYRLAWRSPSGARLGVRGEFREIVAGERIVSTECWDDGGPCGVKTVSLSEADGRTTLVHHVRFLPPAARFTTHRAPGATSRP